METMKKVALRHGLVCLLHEKPFEGVNGSGKHNNWSMSTDKGENLLNPGKTPENNARFLLFFAAVIKAVDEHQDLLRISVATAGNDCRLGGNEAPPAIISMFIGDELQEILSAIEDEREYHGKGKVKMQIGVDELPLISKDTTDRNRTSPFAFTGNKFEFRMAGSSLSVADPNIVLNTIVADVLRGFADRIEAAEDRTSEIHNIIKETAKNHKRILFAGNNYSKEWEEEAKRRGLLNLKSTIDALPFYTRKENIELFERNGILTGLEVKSRYEIALEVYTKDINIEARTMVDMIRQQILPSVNRYMKDLAVSLSAKKSIGAGVQKGFETKLLKKLSSLSDELYDNNEHLSNVLETVPSGDSYKTAVYYKEVVLEAMNKARSVADEIEKNLGREYAPFPSYTDLLFKI
jgi:glutamine synthetase